MVREYHSDSPFAFSTVAFHPDSHLCVLGRRDGTVVIYDVEAGAERQIIEAHYDGVAALAFSPSGQRLASGGADSTIRIWDWAHGEMLLDLPNDNYFCLDVEFSPDGRILAGTDSSPVAHIRVADPWHSP